MAPVDPEHVIRLQHFVPYRLAVLAEQISRAVGAVYAGRFSLTRPEWRVLAALGEHGEMAGTDIARFSALDKMAVSRAVASLERSNAATACEAFARLAAIGPPMFPSPMKAIFMSNVSCVG